MVVAGVLYSRRGNTARARQLLDDALLLKNDDVVALTARGALEMRLGSSYAAQRYFARAHELGGSKVTASNLGAALLYLGEVEQALELMTPMGGESAPPELYSNLAYAQLSTDDVALARASLTRAYFAGADARNPRTVSYTHLTLPTICSV